MLNLTLLVPLGSLPGPSEPHIDPRMPNRHGVDFDQVVRNATDQGIDLSEIALFYEGLTDEELIELKRHHLFVSKSNACVIGRFNQEGVPFFPEKVTGVYSLSA